MKASPHPCGAGARVAVSKLAESAPHDCAEQRRTANTFVSMLPTPRQLLTCGEQIRGAAGASSVVTNVRFGCNQRRDPNPVAGIDVIRLSGR